MSTIFSADDHNVNSVPTINIAVVKTIYDSRPIDQKTIEWPDAVTMFERWSRFTWGEKKLAPLISPTIFHDGHRCNDSATTTGMVLLDTDGGNVSIDKIVEVLREYRFEALIYSSARNRIEEPRWRLAIPFFEQVNATHDAPRTIYRALAGIIEGELGADHVWRIDTTKFAPCSIFYVPGIYTTATSDDGVQFEPRNEFVHVEGDILSYECWGALADELSPRSLPPPLPTRLDSGYLDQCTYEDMESAVDAADNDLDYLSWKKIAAAIYDGGGDFWLFDLFSRKWPKYDRRGTEKAWTEIVRSPMTHVTVGTLFDLAKQSDPLWISPSRQRQHQQSPEGKHLSPRSNDLSKLWWERELDIDLPDGVLEEAEPTLGVSAFDLVNRVIPPREWLLSNVYCRNYLSSTIGEGAAGKTTLLVSRAVALSTGQEITAEHVFQRRRVLYLTLEDDKDELARRVQACLLYHKVDFAEVKDWLYLDAITNGGKLTKADKQGNRTPGELKEKLVQAVEQHHYDMVILDPFVKAHGALSEQDNVAIDAASSVLTDLCVTHKIAVDAPHHVRKNGGHDPGNAEIARGASAFKDAIRLGYTLTIMDERDAERFGLPAEQRSQYRLLHSGKVNITKNDTRRYFHMDEINLGNGAGLYPGGDTIQVMVPWEPPDLLDYIEDARFRECVLDAIRDAPANSLFSADPKATNRHIWPTMQQAAPSLTKEQCERIIDRWTFDGYVRKVEFKDENSRKRFGLQAVEQVKIAPRPAIFH